MSDPNQSQRRHPMFQGGSPTSGEMIQPSESIGPVKLSLTERLTHEKERLVHRIKEIDEVLTALHAQPGVEKVIDLIFRQGIR